MNSKLHDWLNPRTYRQGLGWEFVLYTLALNYRDSIDKPRCDLDFMRWLIYHTTIDSAINILQISGKRFTFTYLNTRCFISPVNEANILFLILDTHNSYKNAFLLST